MKVKIELSGGLDLCFKTKDFVIELKDQTEIKILDLIKLMKEGYLKEKPEFFYQNDNIRPGILVLINDTDWELEGKNEAIIKDNDTVGFISTLHGG